MNVFLEKLATARSHPQAFLPTLTAPATSMAGWNVPLIREFWTIMSDPGRVHFHVVYLEAIHAILRCLDKEPRTCSTIKYTMFYGHRSRQPLTYNDKDRLMGIPLWLHALGVACEFIRFKTNKGQVLAGSTLATQIIVGLAHDIGKLESFISKQLCSVSVPKKQHALFSMIFLERLLGEYGLLTSPEEKKIREAILTTIRGHHHTQTELKIKAQVAETRTLGDIILLQQADSISRSAEANTVIRAPFADRYGRN